MKIHIAAVHESLVGPFRKCRDVRVESVVGVQWTKCTRGEYFRV